jgi:hypothetical protein
MVEKIYAFQEIMTPSLKLFIKLIRNSTFCKGIPIEDYANRMGTSVDVTSSKMDGQTNAQTWY